MFRKMPFVLLAIFVVMGIAHPWIPLSCKSILYGVSVSLKSLILFVLPFLVFGMLFKTAVQLAGRATKVILLLLGAVCLSNFISTIISYGVGSMAYGWDLALSFPEGKDALVPAFSLYLPAIVGNGFAMVSALVVGIGMGYFAPKRASLLSLWMEKGTLFVLKGILFLIPFFIAGVVLKMFHEGVVAHLLGHYFVIFGCIALAVFSYLVFLYLLANGLQLKRALMCLKNMAPAALVGFGSMSSMAAMPLTIAGTEKNAQNKDLARSIIPATVNIHLIGDCFAIPILAFAILKSFGVEGPSFASYLLFSMYFVLAKFSVAAVPGGGILVMLPILESYLGMDAGMLSLITALYILFDPVITTANVLGNGAFALLLSRKRERLQNFS